MRAIETTKNNKRAWKVNYTDIVDGKKTKRRKFFSSEAKAKNWIFQRERGERKLSVETARIANDEFVKRAVALEKKLYPYGANLEDAVHLFIERAQADGIAITLGELRENFMESKRAEGLRDLTIKELDTRTKVFAEHFGLTTKVSALTPAQIEKWLDEIKFPVAPKGQAKRETEWRAAGPQTKNHYRRNAHNMMEYARRFYGLVENPVSKVSKKRVTRDLPDIFTNGQMETLLKAAKGDSELTAWIALGAYAGLRGAEIERLDWSNIHLKTNTITLPPAVTKNRKKRNVEVRPKLKAILQEIEQLGGKVVRDYFSTSTKLQTFKKSLNFEWPHNGLRHSFGTYHYAAFRHAGETAIQMGHRSSPQMLLEHYDRGDITKEQALAWWGESHSSKLDSGRQAL